MDISNSELGYYRLRAVLLVIVTAVVLAAGYLGAYYGLVERGLPYSFRAVYFPAEYRTGGAAAETFFWPAHQLDRRIRPSYWGE